MGIKKDLGQAFKERISDFNDTPDNAVWERIAVELNKDKKKDRFIIIWFRYGTVALALFLILLLYRDYSLDFKNDIKLNTTNNEKNEQNSNTISDSNTNILKQNTSNTSEEQTHIIDNTVSTNTVLTEKLSKLNTTSTHQSSMYTHQKQNDFNTTNNTSDTKKENHVGTNHTIQFYDSISKNSFKVQDKFSVLNNFKDSISSDTERVKNQESISEEKVVQTSMETKHNDTIINKPKESKWSIFPNASLVYYDGFKTSFSKQITTNYGVYFNYLSSKKINIRLGINKLQLQQTLTENNTLIKQSVDYFEIPLEFKYNITQTKIQPYCVAGVSYLFINNAELTITEENSLSTTSSNKSNFAKSTISFNSGLGLQTKLFKDFYFNLESMFKYHFEPYSQSVDVQPYTISILGGVEYKF